MQAKEVKLKDIHIGERFRKEMGDIEELADDIKVNDLIQPISLDPNMNLLAGGRRLAAFNLLGRKKIPAVILKIDNEKDSRIIELAENIHRKGMEWQERAALEKRIHDLKMENDPNWKEYKTANLLDISTSNMDRHLKLAIAMETIPELAECKNESEAWKRMHRIAEDIVTKEMGKRSKTSKIGKWASDHYIIGDAIVGMKKVAKGVAGFAEVDPPYAIQLDKRRHRAKDKFTLEQYNEIDVKDYPHFIFQIAKQVHRILADDTYCIWWFGPTHYQMILDQLRAVRFRVNEVPGIWCKGAAGQTNNPDTTLANCYEMFFACAKGQPTLNKKGRANTFHHNPVPAANKIHPTERPVELMGEIIDTFHTRGSILSPFLGSGAILRAAYERDFTGFGYDLTPELKDRFLIRVEQEHGEDEEDA